MKLKKERNEKVNKRKKKKDPNLSSKIVLRGTIQNLDKFLNVLKLVSTHNENYWLIYATGTHLEHLHFNNLMNAALNVLLKMV